MLCFVVVMQSFIMNSHEEFIHIHQCCFAGTGAIVKLPQCQWSKPDGYGKISQCITTTKHSKAKTVCIFLGIYCKQFHPTLYCACHYLSMLLMVCNSLFYGMHIQSVFKSLMPSTILSSKHANDIGTTILGHLFKILLNQMRLVNEKSTRGNLTRIFLVPHICVSESDKH